MDAKLVEKVFAECSIPLLSLILPIQYGALMFALEQNATCFVAIGAARRKAVQVVWTTYDVHQLRDLRTY